MYRFDSVGNICRRSPDARLAFHTYMYIHLYTTQNCSRVFFSIHHTKINEQEIQEKPKILSQCMQSLLIQSDGILEMMK